VELSVNRNDVSAAMVVAHKRIITSRIERQYASIEGGINLQACSVHMHLKLTLAISTHIDGPWFSISPRQLYTEL